MGSEIIVVPAIFIGLPWIILHYITKWKSSATLTREDENLLEDVHDTARRRRVAPECGREAGLDDLAVGVAARAIPGCPV